MARCVSLGSAGVCLNLPRGLTRFHRSLPSVVSIAQVLVRVLASGVCHSDSVVREGVMPVTPYVLVSLCLCPASVRTSYATLTKL